MGPEAKWAGDAFLFNAHCATEDDEYESDNNSIPALISADFISDNDSLPELVPQVNKPLVKDLVPSSIASIQFIGGATRYHPLIVLFDSGGSDVMINSNALPRSCAQITQTHKSFATTAGDLKTTSTVELSKVFFPEFSRTQHILRHIAHVFEDLHKTVPYNLILGRNFLRDCGILLDFEKSQVQWLKHTIPMRPHRYWSEPSCIHDALQTEPPQIWQASAESHSVTIADAKYEATNIEEIIQAQTHLTMKQRNNLYCTLLLNKPLFSGKLGSYPHQTFSLVLKPSAKPFHAKPYAVPQVHLATFKKELDRLVAIGVLEPIGASLWAASTFIIPKKDGTVRWVSDFHMLNKWIERKQYPLPKIQDILQEQCPYQFITKIDVSMQYYTFRLDQQSSELCTIVTPFGKYRYTGLPIGICQSSDFAQATMEEILRDIANVRVYIDDIKATHVNWDDHIK